MRLELYIKSTCLIDKLLETNRILGNLLMLLRQPSHLLHARKLDSHSPDSVEMYVHMKLLSP